LKSTWALFLGIALMMLGVGLQGTLLGVRATIEGFPTVVTGIIMSAYFAGFVGGSLMTPRLVSRVGHIRVFAALASTASVAALAHGVLLVPWVWILVRLLSGFCMAGLYIVVESWINDRATNESRGKLLSIYMVVSLGSLGLGQFLLNAADPAGVLLFLLASVLVSLAVLPIALTPGSAPAHAEAQSMGIRTLWRVSPLGLVGVMAEGLAAAAFYGMGAVYAKEQGMDAFQVSLFMAAATFGGMIMQWPIGHASDRSDRRGIIAMVSVVGGLACLAAMFLDGIPQLLAVALIGGTMMPLYSLSVAHTNDYLQPSQMVAASSSMILMSGTAAIAGPILASLWMRYTGFGGFFLFIGSSLLLVAAFAIYRSLRGRAARPPSV
jgi:MFS family permease